jgi:hypothetical protein
MSYVKEALVRFKELVEFLECECDSYNGYTCPLHNDRTLAKQALVEYEAPNQPVEPTDETKPTPCAICGCVGYHQNCGTL